MPRQFPFTYTREQVRELGAVSEEAASATRRFAAYLAADHRASRMQTIDFLVALNQRLQGDIKYLIRMEPGVQTPEETLANGSGSCRDTGWLLVQLLRHLGLAARFVSGYLIQLTPDVKVAGRPVRRRGGFHRPARVVRGLSAGRGLDRASIRPPDCSPAKAIFRSPVRPSRLGGADQRRGRRMRGRVRAHMKVERVWEAPRVTKPYTEDAMAGDRSARPAASMPTCCGTTSA